MNNTRIEIYNVEGKVKRTGKDAAKHKRRRTPHAPDACPVCGGSGSYDTLETVEPCPLCQNGQAQVM